VRKEQFLTPTFIIEPKKTAEETPLQSIGRILGGRDHTTIIHGSEKIAADMNKDDNLKNTIEILKKKINPQ